MPKFIIATDQFHLNAIAVAGTDTQWIYNYQVKRVFKILGFLKVAKQVHIHTFSFPRTTYYNPRADGLAEYAKEQRRYAHSVFA